MASSGKQTYLYSLSHHDQLVPSPLHAIILLAIITAHESVKKSFFAATKREVDD
jgi:hypothetical protein